MIEVGIRMILGICLDRMSESSEYIDITFNQARTAGQVRVVTVNYVQYSA